MYVTANDFVATLGACAAVAPRAPLSPDPNDFVVVG